ncbi:TetR family transcriptional regulator [Saccharothrix sp. AJ9571]|nr:TetR family transcriptional regulator [Saccharothrix sp. AJ9571]
MSHSEPDGLAARKRRATSARIAASAARLAGRHGVASTTVEQIAADAEVARATFFRYYNTKESAIAEGVTGPWLVLVTEALARQPEHLSAKAALVAAFDELAGHFSGHRGEIWELARLTRSSPALHAWTAQTYQRYEDAIAGLLAPRFPASSEPDPRPRLLAVLAMGAVRVCLDDWVATGGSLPALLSRAFASITVEPG